MTRLNTDDFLKKSESHKEKYEESGQDYELFIKYIPTNKSENAVKEYFEEKRIKIMSLKILKDS